MGDSIYAKIQIGVISSTIMFILGVMYNTWLQRKQYKLSYKSFLAISPVLLRKDFHEILKGDKAKHLVTNRYKDIRDYYNNTRIPIPTLSFLVLKNLGPGLIFECKVSAYYYVKEKQYTWDVVSTIDLIEKDESIYICVDDLKAPVGTFFLEKAEITYKTQANETVHVIMKFIDEKCRTKYSTKRFGLKRKNWTQIMVPLGLEWEVPNK